MRLDASPQVVNYVSTAYKNRPPLRSARLMRTPTVRRPNTCRIVGAIGLLALALVLPESLIAQSIRGVVIEGNDRPVAGVVVMLIDSAANISARSLSNTAGEFRLAAPRAGIYKIRTLRVGFRPATSIPVLLLVGQEVAQRIGLTGVVFSLDTVRVVARNSCRAVADSGAATFAVWEQVRTALTATQLSATERAITATTIGYVRSLDRNSRRVQEQRASVRSALVTQPWLSVSPDSLHAAGYVVSTGDSTAYYLPGLDMLLSDVFLDDHCLHLVAAPDAGSLGIAFEPIPERSRVAEIRGTLWLDRKSSELRRMEFQYVNLARVQEQRAGGEMELIRMRDGTWAISRWSIRMPVLARRRIPGTPVSLVVVSEIRVSGGELALAVRGRDTLWSRSPLTLSGSVVDSVSGRGLAGAFVTLMGTRHAAVADSAGGFTMPSVLPGEYTAEVHTSFLDEIGALSHSLVSFADSVSAIVIRIPTAQQIGKSLCGTRESRLTGIVVGTVNLRGDTTPPRGLRVAASWKDSDMNSGAPATGNPDRRLETRTDADGRFRLCGVPVRTSLVVSVVEDTVSAESVPVLIATGIFGSADLIVDTHADRGATFAGFVLTDSTRTPIVDAEVSLTDLAVSDRTNDRGAFRFNAVPAGAHRLVVRKFGYGPLDTRLVVVANKAVEREIFLSRTVTLDSVRIVAERPVLPSFEEHRRIGLGKFITRADLEKHEGRRLGELLSSVAGARIVGRAPNAYVASSRGQKSLTGASNCYARVYLDHLLVYGKPGDPLFDLNSIAPGQVEAIEYFPGAASTPLEYSSLNSQCGAIVIWTRR